MMAHLFGPSEAHDDALPSFRTWIGQSFQVRIWSKQPVQFHRSASSFNTNIDTCEKTVSAREMSNMKVVDLEKLWNFVDYKFFIWIHLVPRTNDLLMLV